MKKFLILGCLLACLLAPSPALARIGFQFAPSSDLDLIIYTDDFSWAFGGSVGYDNKAPNTETFAVNVFARHNHELVQKLFFGYGLSLTGTFGEIGGMDIDQKFRIAPYVIFDFHVHHHVVFNAGLTPVAFTRTNLSGASATNDWEVLNTFLSMTVLI